MAFGKDKGEKQERAVLQEALPPKVVHCKKEPYDVYIGRPSKFGNPFSHLPKSAADIKVASRDEAVDFYAEWVRGERVVEGLPPPSLEEIRSELKGKVLGCWCHPQRCHGDVLVELANTPSMEAKKKCRL